MSKTRWTIPFLAAAALLLSACGAGTEASWENETVVVESERLMADAVEADWTIGGGPAGSGESTQIRLRLSTAGGEPIEAFDVNHEKLLHLIVVNKDLSYFAHIHPEYKEDGVFEIANDFPAGGEYRFIADFKPTDGDSMTKAEWIALEGDEAPLEPIAPNASLTDTAGGQRVDLTVDGLEAKGETTLTFKVSDEATGEPVADLEPYLGAIGHVVVLSADGETYVHVHAEEGQGSGPDAVFETSFPQSGVYKLWGQFQRDGQVFTVSYVIDVP